MSCNYDDYNCNCHDKLMSCKRISALSDSWCRSCTLQAATGGTSSQDGKATINHNSKQEFAFRAATLIRPPRIPLTLLSRNLHQSWFSDDQSLSSRYYFTSHRKSSQKKHVKTVLWYNQESLSPASIQTCMSSPNSQDCQDKQAVQRRFCDKVIKRRELSQGLRPSCTWQQYIAIWKLYRLF